MGDIQEKNARLEVLSLCPLFREMSEGTKKRLLALSEWEYSAGEEIGADAPHLGIVTSGTVHIFGGAKDKRVLLNRIEKGQVYGAATVFFEGHGAVSSIVAATKCRVLPLSRQVLDEILREDFAVASAYIGLLSEKIYYLNKRILSFTAKSADAALAGFLLEKATEDSLHISMTRLASALDIGRTTLYRAMDVLTACGAVSCDGKEIRILNKNELKRRALL